MTATEQDADRKPVVPEHRATVFTDLLAEAELLEERLMALDDVPLLLVYTHLTEDESFLREYAPHIKGAWAFEVDDVPDLKRRLCKAIIATFRDYAMAGKPLPPAPEPGLLQRMCDASVGRHVPEEYMPMVLEELNFDGTDAKTVRWRKQPSKDYLNAFKVLVIGAGYSGLAMAKQLRDAGISFLVIEKNPDVGGTWFENTYPGVAVDTPNHFYSYSFRVNPDWDHYFATGPEIIDYIRTCYREMEIADQVRFNEEVISVIWDEDHLVWDVTIRRGDGSTYDLQANAVISATGLLNRPSIPEFPGKEKFKGPMFHSARWDHSVSLEGKRVVQVGTGASGMQLGPKVAEVAEHLTIFQRSPHWARHNPLLYAECSDALKWGLSHVPFYNKWYRYQLLWATSDLVLPTLRKDPDWKHADRSLNAANEEIRQQLVDYISEKVNHDEELLAKIIPPFPPYGKRMLRDSNWYDALTRDNVELVASRVKEITESGVVDEDGNEYPADVIILATGFKAQMPLHPIELVGRNGSIRDAWGEDDPRAHLGITVPGFPNFFILYGPGTNGGHGGSAVFNSECQARYTMLALRELIEREAGAIEVRQEPYEAYIELVDSEHDQLVWSHPGVNNWYRNKAGRVVTNSPWPLSKYHNLTASFDPSEHDFTPRPEQASA